MTAGLIVCGALGREVNSLIRKYNWDAEMIGVKAIDHVYPERIAPDVEARIQQIADWYEHIVVVYGDCGSKGALDRLLERYPDIQRIEGPHCYEFFAGDALQEIFQEETGTYILTDFMVRTFKGLILKSMGLDRFPSLKKEYFRNYKRIVYLMQTDDPDLYHKAGEISEYLELPLETRFTGLGLLETRLVAHMERLNYSNRD